MRRTVTRTFSRTARGVLITSLLILAAGLSCVETGYQSEVTPTGQGSINIKRIPVQKKPKLAERLAPLEQRIKDLETQVADLQAENAQLRAATQPATK